MEDELDRLSTEPLEIPHDFAIDLNLSVVTTYRYALERITAAEKDEMDDLRTQFAAEDYEVLSAALSGAGRDFDELREAASQLALVGAVTRFGHWLDKLTKNSSIKGHLESLERTFGAGPECVTYFKELVDVRDSIIHANAAAEWTHRDNKRCVARYANPYSGKIDFREHDFEEAVFKMIRQISWYDVQLSDAITST